MKTFFLRCAVLFFITTVGIPTSVIEKSNEEPIPEHFLNHIKTFENDKLRRSPAGYVDHQRVDRLSSAKVREIGYGFTSNGLKDVARFNASTTLKVLPMLMTKDEADSFLANELLPAYGKMVDSVVTVPLTKSQRLALISFAFNLGEGSLRRLVTGEDRLNGGNYESVPLLIPLYNRAGGKVQKGLQRRRNAEVFIWLEVVKG